MRADGGGGTGGTREVRGACPHDCPDTCAWVATVEAGVVTGVRGRRDHPVTAGHLCVKVNRYEERLYHPDRILAPLVRTGPKGTASFREATWPEALAAVRAGLERTIERLGPEGVLPFSYFGTQGVLQGASLDRRFFHALGSAELDRSICVNPGKWAWGLTYPDWVPADLEEAGRAQVAVAWGANLVSTHLHFWPKFLEARRNGGTVVCVDPFRSKTARAADVHLQLRPGSDAALALGAMQVIFAEGLEDREFLAERCVGADELRARAEEWPPERAARATGLDARQIVDFARLWGRARPGLLKLGPGAQRHADAGQAFRAALSLPAVTGAWRHPGGGAHVSGAVAFPNRTRAMERPDLRAAPSARTVNMAHLGRALADGGTGALVVYNCNPAVVCPDSEAVLRGLAREDLFSVVLEQMPTETVAYADVVLPATTQLEHTDVLWSWGHRYLTLNRPAVAPRGQALPNTEIFRLLAAEVGLGEPALFDDDETLLATYLDGYPADVRDRLLADGYARIERETPPSARALLRSEPAATRWGVDPLPQGRDDPGGDGLVLLTPKAHHFLNSSLVNHARLRKAAGRPVALVSPGDAEEAGVADGALACLTNDRGTVRLPAAHSADVLAGTVVVLDNWWHADLGGRGVNALMGQDLTDLGAGPIFTARVRLAPA